MYAKPIPTTIVAPVPNVNAVFEFVAYLSTVNPEEPDVPELPLDTEEADEPDVPAEPEVPAEPDVPLEPE